MAQSESINEQLVSAAGGSNTARMLLLLIERAALNYKNFPAIRLLSVPLPKVNCAVQVLLECDAAPICCWRHELYSIRGGL
ncbi:MAG: hypothetical protein GF353_24920 [Candidatus Lokiarchaeota archaeon]|nr:hypothetical protein [Candidatus Lokiarchaeota archaeon]